MLEAAEGIGTVTSSRNSEVIHAGIYYKAGSLMARMCVSGKHALYDYCASHGIPHRNCGKLIVATTPKETEKLQSIRAHAEANGVLDMQLLSGEAARALEPALDCDAALLSPSTGIIDSHAYMLSLRGDAEAAGAAFAFHTPLLRAKAAAGLIELEAGGEAPMTLAMRASGQCRRARRAGGRAPHRRHADRPDPAGLSRQGQLFQLQRAGAVLTADLSGARARRARRASDARHGGTGAVRPRRRMGRHIDYAVDPARAERFYPAIRKYWPTLPDGALMPSYSGIRPKIVPPAVASQDFVMQGRAITASTG